MLNGLHDTKLDHRGAGDRGESVIDRSRRTEGAGTDAATADRDGDLERIMRKLSQSNG
jgi:hypothetical protein